MVSVVAIPFLDETSEVVGRNLRIAATHPAIDLVWGISGPGFDSANLDSAPSSIEIVEQQRIGIRRPGKGDAMNTAIARADEMGVDRLHFYDADITNFEP